MALSFQIQFKMPSMVTCNQKLSIAFHKRLHQEIWVGKSRQSFNRKKLLFSLVLVLDSCAICHDTSTGEV